ncbi:9132_t:CDS:2 [Acaulospora morrowiae]|uniref:9132_t:CDS:1 n=1 Tax=Acaulospora morrowiae TaxID=94023 RepID=A0A9N9F760_9GLOM|nr:9132_t:CDS:2 [Acaulospora morrowiae]
MADSRVLNINFQEESLLVVPEPKKNKLRFLRLLSFVLSQKGYSNVEKLSRKVGLEPPTNEEFHFASNSKPHNHKTAFSAMWCLHNDCLPKTSRTGIKDFLLVYAASTFIEILMQFPVRRRKSPSNKTNVNDIIGSPFVPPFLAGLLAGPTLLIDNNQSRRISISMYMLSKSLQFVYHALRKNGIIPVMPWWWGSWLIFPISSSQLIYAYMVHPDAFPDAYGRFITSRSSTYVQKRPKYFLDSMPWPTGQEIVERITTIASLHYPGFYSPKLHGRDISTLPDALKPIRPVLEIAHPAHNKMMCALLHPNDPSCLATYFKFIAKEGVAALKFMVALQALSLIFKWKTLVSRPNEVLTQFLNGGTQTIFKGATFITMAIATSWAMICGFQNVLPNKFMPISRESKSTTGHWDVQFKIIYRIILENIGEKRNNQEHQARNTTSLNLGIKSTAKEHISTIF